MKSESLNQVRVIGGELRSRKITFSDREGLRPTADRIRETLFNWLQFDLANSHCLDLYAGSGALGIESLSRGAKSVRFIESDLSITNMIIENLARLELSDGLVECKSAEKWLLAQDENSDKYKTIFIDPPFGSNQFDVVLPLLDKSQILAQGCKIYIEWNKPLSTLPIPSSWVELKTKKAGKVYFGLWRSGN